MPKRKLKHALPTGKIATRQTDRDYRFVWIARLNVENEVSRIEATRSKEISHDLKVWKKDRIWAKEAQEVGLDGTFTNWNGCKMLVSQHHLDHAAITLERTVESITVEANEKVDKEIERVQRRTEETEWFVGGWSARHDSAMKAAFTAASNHSYEIKVEEINHGEIQ